MVRMREVKISIDTASWQRDYGYHDLFEVVSAADILQNLTLTRDVFVDLWRLQLRPGRTLSNLIGPLGIEDATLVEDLGNHQLAVVRAPFHGFLKHWYFSLGVHYSHPLILRPNRVILTIFGPPTIVSACLSYLDDRALRYRILASGPHQFGAQDLLRVLTPRQREVLGAAVQMGWFEHPRKVTARALGKSLGISHQAVIESLHRGQRRVWHHLIPPDEGEAPTIR